MLPTTVLDWLVLTSIALGTAIAISASIFIPAIAIKVRTAKLRRRAGKAIDYLASQINDKTVRRTFCSRLAAALSADDLSKLRIAVEEIEAHIKTQQGEGK